MLNTQLPGLYIQDEPKKGRSVYCIQDIQKGDMIELCPAIILSRTDTEKIHTTGLHDYYFIWDLEEGSSAIALGYGSLYNHSSNPNAEFETDHDSRMIKIIAFRDIDAHEEICLDYTSGLKTEHGLWFDPE